jgi:UDP-galactopyranose mutase
MLIEPCAYDEKSWQVYVHQYGEHLTEEEKRVLLDYLTDPNEAYY